MVTTALLQLEVIKLKRTGETTRETYENRVRTTREDLGDVQKTFRSVRDQLQLELRIDEKKLASLTTASNRVLEYLKVVLNKGRQIVGLADICSKYETEEEKVMKWYALRGQNLPDTERASETTATTSEFPEKVLQPNGKTKFVQESFKPLFELDGLWSVHSKAKVSLLELKKEKEELTKENEQLKELLRNVLECDVLQRSLPCSRVSSGVVSKKIRYKSAKP